MSALDADGGAKMLLFGWNLGLVLAAVCKYDWLAEQGPVSENSSIVTSARPRRNLTFECTSAIRVSTESRL
jgi:hypothetical protein